MMTGFAWAKRPMLPRLADLKEDLPMTVIYGEQSWVTAISRSQYDEIRKKSGFTEVEVSKSLVVISNGLTTYCVFTGKPF
jgi:hypothetical protein